MSDAITASYSEIDTFRQCPKKHEISYKQRWTRPTRSPALIRGTRWHEVLETHYGMIKDAQAAGVPEDEILDRCRAAVRQLIRDQAVEAILHDTEALDETVQWMYDGYIEAYGIDPQWKILAVEYKDEHWLPDESWQPSRFKLKVRVDLIVKDLELGGIWLVDHKSAKNLPKRKDFDLDDQFGLYEWAMRQSGRKILGTIHSAARTHRNKDQDKHPQPLDERFARTRMNRTDTELDQIAIEAYRTLETAYSYGAGLAPRSPNPDTCSWRCDYTEPCLMARKGMETAVALRDFGFHQDFTRH